MKTKVEIFSSKKLKNFFINLDSLFDLSLKGLDELESGYNSKNLSIVFFDNQDCVGEKILNNILLNENFIFIYKELSMFEKTSLDLKKNFHNFALSPLLNRGDIRGISHPPSSCLIILIQSHQR